MIKIMGIQNYLKRVSKATKDIKSAIEEKGVSVAQCDGFETLADKVRAIQTGSSSDGSSLFTVLAFKSSQTRPSTPSGGSFTASSISYPSGWSDGAGLSKYVWMSYIVFKGDGSVYKNWVSPILVNGVITDSGDPIDLTDVATRTWVVEQLQNLKSEITEEVTNNVTNNIKQEILNEIDLSSYATKSYVDQKISELPGGSAGSYVKSINGSTGEITFTGSGVSKSGNTFTFNAGSGSGTTTSINGETGEITFTGDGVSKNGKTFTFVGGSSSSDAVKKSYVDSQDASTLKSAKDYADGLVKEAGVTSINSIKGIVTLKGSDSVTITRGSDGQSLEFSATGGEGGGDGDIIRSFNIYKNTDSRTDIPEIPAIIGSEPYWDYTSGDLKNCPSGWSTDMTFESDKYTWMASAFFSKKNAGAMEGSWQGPICITGIPGRPGEDGSSIEFIYALTRDTTTRPNYPTTTADRETLFANAEGGDDSSHYATWNGQRWYDRAQAIDSTNNKACWAAQRVKYSESSDWIYSESPIIWANWGSDGTDGDGVEYIFFLTDDAHQAAGKWYSDADNFEISYTNAGTVNGVSTAYDNTIDDWVPNGWTDEPQDVSLEGGFYEFCAVRKSKDGIWQEFSVPALWAKYAMDGKDGSSIEYVFACTNDDLTPEQVSVDNDAANADNAHTTDEYLPNFNFNGSVVKATDDPISVTVNNKYQWVSVRRRKRGATEWGDFSHPALWNKHVEGGYNGDTYATARLFIAHTTYDENNPPAVPVVTSTYDVNTRTVINPPTGWSEKATKTEAKPYIWEIWGSFSENTGNQVGKWSDPYCTTGAPGPSGEDGDEIEEVYCLNKDAVVPAISSSSVDQNGKTKSEDGYLPKFVFNGTPQNSVASQLSVSEEYPYCYGAKRRKHKSVWLDFSDAYLVANFVKQGLSQDDKDLIQAEVSSQIGSSLEDANKRITAIQDRVENIDGTDATFLVDNKEGIIQAITQYKDENKESFSDLILDGSEAKVKAWAGGKFTEDGKTLLKDAGIDLDGMDATVKQWATFYDETTMKTGSVRQILDGEKSAILTEATKAAEDKVNIAYTKWDADKATITSDVAKAQQFWGEYDKDKIKIIKQTDYDLSNVGENKTYKNVEAYETAMENAGWTKIIVTEALSRISQEAGKLTLAVNEGESWASIVAKANANGNSELCLDADQINLSGTTNATQAVIGNATITGATITNGSITNAKINSCEITSQIKSSNYSNGKNPTTGAVETKKGYLFDAAGEEFAIYAVPDTNGDPTVEITSSRFKIPSATITEVLQVTDVEAVNLKVKGANIDELSGTKITAGTITGNQIAAKAITAENIDTSTLTLDTLQSHDFSETSGSEKGFKLDGSKTESSFALYGTSPVLDAEGNETEETANWAITSGKVSLPAAFIENLTVGRINNWEGAVESKLDQYFSISDGDTENSKIISLAKSVSKFIANDTDFVTHTLTTDDGNGGHVYIGKDFKNSEPGIIVYTDSRSKSVNNLNHQVTDSYTWDSNKLTLTDAGSIRISKFGASFGNRIVGKNVERTVSLIITLEGPSTKTLLNKSKTGTGSSGGATFRNDDDWMVETQTITGLPAGEYYIKAVWSVEHGGGNALYNSNYWISLDSISMKSIYTSDKWVRGIFIGANGFKIANGTNLSGESKELSVTIPEDPTKDIAVNGFVTSPDNSVNKIRVVDSANQAEDADTLYIILKS